MYPYDTYLFLLLWCLSQKCLECPSTQPFSHRCSSLRSSCTRDYIFDEFGSYEFGTTIVGDEESDDLTWLNTYGSNDAIFSPPSAFASAAAADAPPSPQVPPTPPS